VDSLGALTNQFTPLDEDPETMQADDAIQPDASATQAHTRHSKPPPFYIYGIKEKFRLIKTLLPTLQAQPAVYHNSDSIVVHFKTWADLEKVKAYCQQQGYDHAMERPRQDRPLKVVIRKLPIDASIVDIKLGFMEKGYPVLGATQMTGRSKQDGSKIPYPLFILSLQKVPGIEEIYKESRLHCFKIQIEPLRSIAVVQCYKCQRIGHSQHLCNARANCVKCALPHQSYLCPKTDKSTPPKCVNCTGQHTANYRGCPVIRKAQEKRNAATTPPHDRNPQHHAPGEGTHVTQSETRRNAWTKRTNEPSQRETTSAQPDNAQHQTSSADDAALTAHFAQGTTQSSSTAPTTPAQQSPHNHAQPHHTTSSSGTTSPTTADATSLLSGLKELMALFKGLNIHRIMQHVRSGLQRFRQAPDEMSKLLVLVEIITTILSDDSTA
jgi:hypothetical protein